METWKPVIGFESLYEVSSLGRIKRIAKGGRAQIGRILACQIDKQGYVRINLCHQRKRYPKKLHRLVSESFIALAPIQTRMTVNHKNGIKSDNRVENLEIVTRSENIKHAFRVIRTQKVVGDRNPRATMTATQVLDIRQRLQNGERPMDLVRELGINKYRIYDIQHRRTWTHI